MAGVCSHLLFTGRRRNSGATPDSSEVSRHSKDLSLHRLLIYSHFSLRHYYDLLPTTKLFYIHIKFSYFIQWLCGTNMMYKRCCVVTPSTRDEKRKHLTAVGLSIDSGGGWLPLPDFP